MTVKPLLALFSATLTLGAHAQEDDAAAAMARALQDPLASIKMLATDNTIGFNSGDDEGETNYNFQIQPVYSIPRPALAKTNLIARAVIPIIGLEPGTVEPPIGPDPTPSSDSHWGLSDTTLQLYISPKSDNNWKWGLGPQISLPTHTSDRTKGPGWGLGVAGVLVGSFTEQISFAAIAMHHVGEEDNFETTAVQPMLFYNFKSVPGMALSYNNMISYNWQADSGNHWNVPWG
ncbi:MAG: transporter [Pseudomonadales bacterium]